MYLVIAILSPLTALHHYLIDRDEPEVIGEDVIVPAPLRLCPECAASLQSRPRLVRERLEQLPLYQPLFRDYPAPKINITPQR